MNNTSKIYSLTYSGKQLSLNTIRGNSWHKYQKEVDSLKWMFLSIIRNACLPKMQEFGINVRYNSRLDPDNLSFTTKIFVDVLRREGIVPDDTRKQYKYFNVVPDGELPENTAVFIIEHLK